MKAGCYERKNGHWSKVSFARGKLWKLPRCGNCGKIIQRKKINLSVIFPPVSTALGKLSAKNKSAESFPQFPQLRRLGVFSQEEPVSRRRYPSLCFAETY